MSNGSDFYNPGVLVDEISTGEKPQKAGNVEELMWLHVNTRIGSSTPKLRITRFRQ